MVRVLCMDEFCIRSAPLLAARGWHSGRSGRVRHDFSRLDVSRGGRMRHSRRSQKKRKEVCLRQKRARGFLLGASVGEKFSVVAIDKYRRTASGTWGGAEGLRKFCREKTRRSRTPNRKGKSCL